MPGRLSPDRLTTNADRCARYKAKLREEGGVVGRFITRQEREAERKAQVEVEREHARLAPAQSLEQPVVDLEFLTRALADPTRIQTEMAKFKADPDTYIEQRFTDLSSYDFPVYTAINIKIQTKKGRLAPLILNRIQRQLWKWLLEDMAAGKIIRWFIGKARQEGVSTEILALFLWICSLRADRNTLVASYDLKSVNDFNSRLRAMHANSHPLLRPQALKSSRDIVHFGNKTTERLRGAGAGLDSRIVFCSAGSDELGRSFNFTGVLMSEVGIWASKGISIEDQLGALQQTVADEPGTMIFMETTFKGEGEAAKYWRDQENGFRKIFISWVAHDEYRRPLRPGESLEPLCDTEESTRWGNEIAESRHIVTELHRWYPEEIEDGGDEWIEKEIQARLNWRRYIIAKKCNGNLSIFRHEYPTCEAHMLSASGKHCFDHYSLELMRAHVKAEGIIPERFNYIHDPQETDPEEKFIAAPYGQLIVWKRPEPDGIYVIGADPAMGIPNSGDHSAALVLRVDDGLEEVASFSSIITPDKFSELLYYLSKLYCTPEMFGFALTGVELNERGGYFVNLDLYKRLQHPRLYKKFEAFDKKAAIQPGFVVGKTNKSSLVAAVQQRVFDREILVRTGALPEQKDLLLDQLQHYQMLENEELGAPPGHRDDLVSALLIGVQLSTKIHAYPAAPDGPPKDSLAWHLERQEQRRRYGTFGRY